MENFSQTIYSGADSESLVLIQDGDDLGHSTLPSVAEDLASIAHYDRAGLGFGPVRPLIFRIKEFGLFLSSMRND